MSGQPPGAGGASFLPFMTSVTTDIYDRIERIVQSIETVKATLREVMSGIGENLGKLSKGIDEMIEQGEMNKDMVLGAFADTTNNLAQQIRIIRNENIQATQSEQTRQLIASVSATATLLETRMYDIQIAFLINGVHALMNAVKAGKVVGIPVPVKGAVTAGAAKTAIPQPELAAPVPSLTADAGQAAGDKQKAFFGKGVRKKTHDEIMEEKRKKDKLFGRFLK